MQYAFDSLKMGQRGTAWDSMGQGEIRVKKQILFNLKWLQNNKMLFYLLFIVDKNDIY